MDVGDPAHDVCTLWIKLLAVHFDRLIKGTVESITHLALFAAEFINHPHPDRRAGRYFQRFLRQRERRHYGHQQKTQGSRQHGIFTIHNLRSPLRVLVAGKQSFHFGMQADAVWLHSIRNPHPCWLFIETDKSSSTGLSGIVQSACRKHDIRSRRKYPDRHQPIMEIIFEGSTAPTQHQSVLRRRGKQSNSLIPQNAPRVMSRTDLISFSGATSKDRQEQPPQ